MINNELKNVKSVCRLILYRLVNKDKYLTLFWVFSLIIVILSIFVDLELFLNQINTCIRFICQGEPIYYTLAVSIMSGLFVYFVTVIIPEVRQSRPIYVEICQQFQKIEDLFEDFKQEVGDFSDDEKIKDVVVQVKRYGKDSSNEHLYNLNLCKTYIENFASKFETLTGVVLTYAPHLAEKELELLVDIRHRNITKRLIYLDGVENYLTENEVNSFFTDIAKLNRDISILHQDIKERTYLKN